MFCMLNLSEAFAVYFLLIAGVIAALFCIDVWRARADDWRLHRLGVRRCSSCGLVFAVGRFAKRVSAKCPRCGGKRNKRVEDGR